MYTTLDIAYNDNSAELDKMAREINNKKTNLFKSVYNDFENKQKKWENDIIEYNNSYKNPYGHFNSHPDSEKSENSKKSNISYKNKSKYLYDDSISESTINSKFDSDSDYDFTSNLDSISIDSPSLDSYIDNIKEKSNTQQKNSIHNFIKTLKHNKKNNKNQNKHNEHLNDDEDIFTHIKYCFECREQLLKYMKNHNHNNTNNNNHNNNNNENDIFKKIRNTESLFSYFGTLELKEIILIIVLGIVLIIILDFLMRTLQYQNYSQK